MALLLFAAAGTVALPASADTAVTLTDSIDATFLAATCGPVATAHFAVPANATVVDATLAASLDALNTTALSAVVEVRAAASTVASNSTASGLGLLGPGGHLNASLINAELPNMTRENGTITVALAVVVCPSLGVAAVALQNATLTYTTPPAPAPNATAPSPIVNVTFGAGTNGSIAAGEPTNATPVLTGNVSANATFEWLVDGALVSTEPTLANYTFEPGTHNVTVRITDGGGVSTYSVWVTASARTPPGVPFAFYVVLGAAGAASLGAVVAGTDRGRYFLFASSVGSVFSRLKKASLLDHFVRGTLYQVIRENPGIHFAQLRRRTDLANGEAAHHLRMLERGGYLRVVVDGTKTKFYTTDRPLEAEVYGISDTERAILSAITEAPGMAQSDLVLKLDRSASAISRSVTRLVSLGYVVTRHEGARVLVFPREGADLIDPLTPSWPDEGA